MLWLLKRYCSILNFHAIVFLVESQLKMKKALRKKLADFEKAVDQFNTSTKMVQLAELVKEKQTLTGNDKIVKLVVRNFWNSHTIKQFEYAANKILGTLYNVTTGICISNGSICISWLIPDINVTKLIPDHSLEFLKIIGVLSLHVGDVIIYNIENIEGEGCETIEAAMLQAIELKNTQAIELLLAMGCNLDVATCNDDNAVTTIVNHSVIESKKSSVDRVCIGHNEHEHEILKQRNETTTDSIAMAVMMKDDAKLHKFCHEGKITKIEDYFDNMEDIALKDCLNNRRGVFGYTPLHEAVSGNKPKVISYLCEKGANVNSKANSGYTPLHLAASAGHIDCVNILLECGADIRSKDDYGKTPKQTAELSRSKSSIVKLLRSEEIIKEVETNGENLTKLLRVCLDLEKNCLERALIAAVKNGNHFNVGKLVVKGATNVDDALELATQLRKHEARAMLLLVKAAQTGDKDLVLRLFGAPTPSKTNEWLPSNDDDFPEVQKSVTTGNVSTVVPIEIARRANNGAVREELLLRTDVNQEEGLVYWHGLRLTNLDLSWFEKISWVKKLRLARNGLKSIPKEIGGYLRQVTKLDLQHNQLTSIPKCLLELPGLTELNLSLNKLTEIPDVQVWSPGLTVLDLSHNELSYLPNDVVAPSIRTLLIADNKFRTVPLCVCSFLSLQYLDISNNPDILSLPVEMGRLSNLNKLTMKGIKCLNDPPRSMQQNTQDCIRYLKSKLRSSRRFNTMKLFLVGEKNSGKRKLVSTLHQVELGDDQVLGIDITELCFSIGLDMPRFRFNIWKFNGQEEYNATHQCFLSERSMYLLLWNVKHGEGGVADLKPWLDDISSRAPQSSVLIVGTHLDEVVDSEQPKIDTLLNMVGELAQQYPKLQVNEVLAVGLMNRLKNVRKLQEAIYNQAAKIKGEDGVPVMTQKIPCDYFQLNQEIESIQHGIRQGNGKAIMTTKEFNDFVKQLNLPDICSDEELRTATLFLNEVGTILHYDDRSHGLNELYFIDPRWLCDMMFKVVTENKFINNGILHIKDVPLLFNDFPIDYCPFQQFLTLLDRFEIALPLDNKKILIPSMLPKERSNNADLPNSHNGGQYCKKSYVFESLYPPRFWSRFISRIMHTVPEVCQALNHFSHLEENKTEEDNLPQVETAMSVSVSVTDEASSPQQVAVSSLISGPTPSNKVPFELPNIRRFIVGDEELDIEAFDGDDIEIVYWREGFAYKSSNLSFCVECLQGNSKEIVFLSSRSDRGMKIMKILNDKMQSLIDECYPGVLPA